MLLGVGNFYNGLQRQAKYANIRLCGTDPFNDPGRCQNHIRGHVLGYVWGFASAKNCYDAAKEAVKRAANNAPQGTQTRHCTARCAQL